MSIVERVRNSPFPKRDLMRYALARAGFGTDTEVHYPDLPKVSVVTKESRAYPIPARGFRVRYHPIWKQMERGEWEHRTFQRLASLINVGDTIIDAGAWFGTHTLFMSALVGEAGHIYAFEPDPNAFDILTANLQLNFIHNVTTRPWCLADGPDSTVTLRSLHFGNSASSITTFDGVTAFKGDEVSVPMTTIDRFCETNNIKPAGIKMDIQGAEIRALHGASRILDMYHPWVIAEFHGRHFPDQQVRSAKWMDFMKIARSATMVEGDWNDVATVYLQT